VDDEAYNTEVLETIIISLGIPAAQVVACMSGKEALEILATSLDKGGS